MGTDILGRVAYTPVALCPSKGMYLAWEVSGELPTDPRPQQSWHWAVPTCILPWEHSGTTQVCSAGYSCKWPSFSIDFWKSVLLTGWNLLHSLLPFGGTEVLTSGHRHLVCLVQVSGLIALCCSGQAFTLRQRQELSLFSAEDYLLSWLTFFILKCPFYFLKWSCQLDSKPVSLWERSCEIGAPEHCFRPQIPDFYFVYIGRYHIILQMIYVVSLLKVLIWNIRVGSSMETDGQGPTREAWRMMASGSDGSSGVVEKFWN